MICPFSGRFEGRRFYRRKPGVTGPGGYDWHAGHWSWGPQLTVDLIEDGNTTYYAGFSVGYGW